MLSYSETMERLSQMKSRFDSGFSSADKLFIMEMHELLFGLPIQNPGCNDCYRDAYILIVNHLKRTGTMPKKGNFVLRNGVLLTYKGKHYTNANLTDDIAMEALNENMKRLDLFTKVPDNYAERIASYFERLKSESEQENDPAVLRETIKSLKSSLNATEDELKEVETANAEAQEEIANLRESITKSKEEAQEEVGRLNELLAKNDAEAKAEIARLNKLLEAKESEHETDADNAQAGDAPAGDDAGQDATELAATEEKTPKKASKTTKK